MKLFIKNGENNDEKLEICINEDSVVKFIKYKVDEILHGNGNFIKFRFKLIHKNIVLLDNNSTKFYKICENDEIWFGKIENYLRKDDIIVYVFCFEHISGYEYLIVKMNDTISTIRSIVERIHSEVIDIWNADGKQMKNGQSITEIDINENYKLIIRCDDGEGNEIYNTFDQCCYLHDKHWVDQYLFTDQVRDNNKNDLARIILIIRMIKIKQIISSIDTIDERLNQNLSDLPSSFINSKTLFCDDMTTRMLDICYDYLRSVILQYENDVARIFDRYFLFAIFAALWNFSNIRQQSNNKTDKLMSDILIDTLDYFMKYLIDSSNDWRYWLKLWMNYYLLRSFSDSDLNEMIDENAINKFIIKLRINGNNINKFIPLKPETITKAKQQISAIQKVDMKHLFCIKPGGDDKLNDEDKFEDEFIIEIVFSIDDIEILKSIGRGAFGETLLCRDKISNKQFVLKKPIGNDVDLYRDINIYSKLNKAIHVTNYSGLFRDRESICIGMEYMSKGSLRSYLEKRKRLSEQEILEMSYEILKQINELHKLGIIHRDIKSDNILVDEDNHAKLIDFGLSKYTIGLTSKDLLDKLKEYVPGTKCYMAPELIEGEQYSDKIDIWSFGLLMVEMVTGRSLKDYQVILKIKDCGKYEFKPKISMSNELKQLINFCLNTNPDERPSAEQLLKHFRPF